MADLDHPCQTHKLGFVDLITSQQFGVLAEIPQEPVQFPQGSRAAIDPARKDLPGKPPGLTNGQSERVVSPQCLPLKLRSLHTNQEDTVGDHADTPDPR